jgi:ubiquinone/menaquinone biosynthesis C-methylase UbiE
MEYVCAPAEDMPLADGEFDVVSSFNSLDHVEDVGRVAAETVRVLAPGGTFLLITEVGHPPQMTEPQDFGWEITERFAPPLELIGERRLEASHELVYASVQAGVESAGGPSGILLARFRRGAQADR